VSFEAAIQTQRNALLRLVAGWLAFLVLLSAAPVSLAWTLQIRVFLFSVLSRAELAGRYLLLAQAKSSARRLGIACPVSHSEVDPLFANGSNRDEPPSLAELRVRFLALRCLLKTYPVGVCACCSGCGQTGWRMALCRARLPLPRCAVLSGGRSSINARFTRPGIRRETPFRSD